MTEPDTVQGSAVQNGGGDRAAASLGIVATVDDTGLSADHVIIGFAPGRERGKRYADPTFLSVSQ